MMGGAGYATERLRAGLRFLPVQAGEFTDSFVCARRIAAVALLAGALLWAQTALQPGTAAAAQTRLEGRAVSGGRPLPSMRVTLYRSARKGGTAIALGRATTDGRGTFELSYSAQRAAGAPVLYVIARHPAGALSLAAVVARPTAGVVVNERTTVAAGYGFAQFFHGPSVAGRAPGPANAAAMAGNLADPTTGRVDGVLGRPPNGRTTPTLKTFNTLANMVSTCVGSPSGCARFLRLARAPAGATPGNTLQAVVNIAKYPWHNVRPLVRFSRSAPSLYGPELGPKQGVPAWTLALRFAGDGMSMDGPGNFAIDAKGNLWVANNYSYGRNPFVPQCGSEVVLEFTPDGRYAPGSPFRGGGLSGAGYGIGLAPNGDVWVGNFGFAAPVTLPDGRAGCAADQQPPHNSVSRFSSAGVPLSGPHGFTDGPLSWPQGTISDRGGTIWIANCGNDSVTRYPEGRQDKFQSSSDIGIKRPFDISIDHAGRAFVTGNESNNVAVLNPDGSPAMPPISGHGINAPLGVAGDSRGNMWVANSGVISVPCPGYIQAGQAPGGSVTLIRRDGKAADRNPYATGHLTVPWGVDVDGNDNLWVASFTGRRIVELCGVPRKGCRPGNRIGDPISPRVKGYKFKGLERVTGVAADPSGNLWATNNWKRAAVQSNPGGLQIVAFVGLAAPLRTPVIGPPQPG
jgi:sugar lactone lactonase YvrE